MPCAVTVPPESGGQLLAGPAQRLKTKLSSARPPTRRWGGSARHVPRRWRLPLHVTTPLARPARTGRHGTSSGLRVKLAAHWHPRNGTRAGRVGLWAGALGRGSGVSGAIGPDSEGTWGRSLGTGLDSAARPGSRAGRPSRGAAGGQDSAASRAEAPRDSAAASRCFPIWPPLIWTALAAALGGADLRPAPPRSQAKSAPAPRAPAQVTTSGSTRSRPWPARLGSVTSEQFALASPAEVPQETAARATAHTRPPPCSPRRPH